MQVKVLEDLLLFMNSQHSRDLEAHPIKLRAVNVELSKIFNGVDRIQVTTAVTKHKKKALMGCLHNNRPQDGGGIGIQEQE